MMIKKKLGVLAAAVAAVSSAHAAFDQGNAVLYAYESDSENTYFVDLGVTAQDLANSVSVDITDSGLSSWLSSNTGATWPVVGTINDSTLVGGPPAVGKSYANNGIIGTSLSASAVKSQTAQNLQQQETLNDWLDAVAVEANGATSVAIAGGTANASNTPRENGFFNSSAIGLGTAAALYYNQAANADGDTTAADTVFSQIGTGGTPSQSSAILTADGSFSANLDTTAVPVPAAAWLFGSALAGLAVVRRRK